MTNQAPFDGHQFLDHLRRSSGAEANNGDSIFASDAKGRTPGHRGNWSSLSDVFEPPDEMLQNENIDDSSSLEKSESSEEEYKRWNENTGGKPPIMPQPSTNAKSNLKPSSACSPPTPSLLSPRPHGIAKHGRNVSWSMDGEDTALNPEKNDHLNQPRLDDDQPFESLSKAHEDREVETKNNAADATRKLTISDVAPFESESDTAILNDIDRKNEERVHNRSDTGTSTILSQVPATVQHDFTFSPMPGDNGVDEAPRNRARTFSRGHAGAETMPLVNEAHRPRGMSVEMKLVDLTESLLDMHGTEPGRSPRRGHKYQPSLTATDRLTKDIEKMEQRERPSPPSSPRKSTRNFWGDTGIPNSKSDDSTIEDGPDTTRMKSTRNLWGAGQDNISEIPSQKIQDHESISPSRKNGESERSLNASDVEDMEKGIQGSDHTGGSSDSFDPKNIERRKKKKSMEDHLASNYAMWSEFFRPRKGRVLAYMKSLSIYVIMPLIGISAILFYLFDNPPTGEANDGKSSDKASTSYILLFCVRQIMTFSLAFGFQAFVIDFLALGTPVLLKLCGPVVTLIIAQSKGWPHVLFWWSILDFSLLAGDGSFAHHWIFYQDYVGLFNERNPSGQIVDNPMYLRVLTIAVILSIIVAIKRFLVGLYLGRQTFAHYGQPLAEVMQKMLLVSQVANLAQEVEYEPVEAFNYVKQQMRSVSLDEEATSVDQTETDDQSEKVIDMNKRHALTGSLEFSEKMKLLHLLDQWEEPARRDHNKNEIATISAVLRFRKALAFMEKKYPFGSSFGNAENREACIGSSQEVYRRLLKASSDDIVQFELLALLALDKDGIIDQSKAKALIKLFRPDRQGRLTCLDFVKSVDAVYKEFRMLGATIDNSSQIDRAFENIFNVGFYIVTFTIILSQLGFDPLALFLSLSSVILAFAFMIGSASSKYFEGVLFILLRRPYGIGDRIQVGGIESDGGIHGALPWNVEHVTLFETTLTFLPTNERASLSNGSLANSRIINWARSPQAQFHIFLQFPLDTPYHKLEKFKMAVEEYMKARPREWRALNGFRVNHVFAKENYMEHYIVIQHREPWQNVGQVLDSKANLTSYCQEVARELEMEYEAPRLPVDLTYSKADPDSKRQSAVSEQMDAEGLMRQFSSIAKSKHAIATC